MPSPLRVAFVLVAVAVARPALGQDADFGVRFQGGPYDVRVFIDNVSCAGTHSVLATVQGAPWLTLPGAREPVQVGPGETVDIAASIDLTNVAPGAKTGTLTFLCMTCTAQCKQNRASYKVSVTVLEREMVFNGPLHAGDNQFGGLVNNKPVDICDLITSVVDQVANTAWGKGTRGGAIINELRTEYMDSGCSDITFHPTTQTVDDKGKPTTVPPTTEDAEPPGNATYVRTPRAGGAAGIAMRYSEEINVGIDQTATGLECARQNPGAYYVFTYDGKLGVMLKQDLVHNLFHEGLHAVNGGAHNVARTNDPNVSGASLEEENDGFKAGDEACTALGITPTGQTAGPGYNNAGSNPGYKPLP